MIKKTFESEFTSCQPVIYKGRRVQGYSKPVAIDVRNFIFYPDQQIFRILKKLHAPMDHKSATHQAMWTEKFLKRHIKYAYDETTQGFTDFWQFPNETITLKSGDCEDFAILGLSILLHLGVHSDLLRVVAGTIRWQKEEIPHAWILYYESSDRVVPIDPVSPFNTIGSMTTRKNIWDHPNYHDITFMFNQHESWKRK